MQRRFLILILACAATTAAAADVYKWTDAGGVVHYSDTEPAADVKAAKLHLAGTATTEVDAQSAAPAEDSAGATAAPQPNPAGSTRVSSVRNTDKLCEQARRNLELLQSGTPVGLDTRGAGQPEPLDDNARQAQIARAQTLIATYCK